MNEWSFQIAPWSLVLAIPLAGMVVILGCMHWRRHPAPRRAVVSELLRLLVVAGILTTLARPELVRRLPREHRPQVVLLADLSHSMDTQDVSRSTGDLETRRTWVQRQLQGPLTAALEPRFDVGIETFGEANTGTDLNTPLARLPEAYPHLHAVVLLSDGDWNRGGSPVAAATRLALAEVPVFGAAVGSDDWLPDMELTDVRAPAFSLLRERVTIPFSVRSHLAHDVRTEIQLHQGDEVLATQPLLIPAHGQVRETLAWRTRETGEFQLTLELPAQPGELTTDNNTRTFRLAVREERLSVLILESRPRWEYRYLRNALMRDPGVDVQTFLVHPSGEPGQGAGYLQSFPATRDRLAGYDVVFVGDVGLGEGELQPEYCELLAGLVEHQASGLVFLPGSRGRQLTLADSALGPLLPVDYDPTAPRGFGQPRPVSLDLTNTGSDHLLALLAESPAANRQLWAELPGFYWCAPVMRARPGAKVLAVHGNRQNRWGRLPLLIIRPAGRGNVLFMGIDSAWRWRRGVEDTYHYRFWGQVVRWMAHSRHLAHGGGLRLTHTPENPRQGQTVFLHATAADAAGYPLAEAAITAIVRDPEGRTERLLLNARGSGWGAYAGQFTPRLAADYQVRLETADSSAQLETVIHVDANDPEQLGHPARHDVIRELTRLTRGRFVTTGQLPELLASLRELPQPEPRQQVIAVWNSWWWLLLLIGLYGLHWVWRKRIGSL